ncbi:MAG: helix-turn-helix transcriptional regulator [Thermoproteus sp.]|nr:helix-turn-helix transcriptional regulator [Thermoproteus sp.]
MLLPLSFGAYSVYIPAGHLAHITPSLPPICNATGPLIVQGPAQINYVCYNNTTQTLTVRGSVEVQLQRLAGGASTAAALAVAATGGLAALSYLAADRREALAAALAPIAGRVKRAAASDDPVREEIVGFLNRVGAATMSQIVKAVGKSWGTTQWHLYVLEREGMIKSVRVGPLAYYFTNPRMAAGAILKSIDPSTLPLEEREKLISLINFA